MSLGDVYRDAWEEKFGLGKGWSANWWPGTAISLGQRGVIRNGQLQYRGYVGDYGVSFNLDPAPSPVSGAWDYSSSSKIDLAIGTDAKMPGWQWLGQASAGLSLRFGNEESMYFSANGTTIERVADVDKLKADLITTAVQQGMPIGQSVVVERQLTTQAMLVASSGGSGELKATVRGNVKVSPFVAGTVASLAGCLDVKKQTGGTSKQDFPSGMVLAFRAVTLGKRGWWWWQHFTVQGVQSIDVESFLDSGDYFALIS
jgi:hypothetical protein